MFGIHIDPHQFDLRATIIALISFLVLVGVMVVAHELGHFIVAKLCKVRVEAFSFGFGPRLFGFKRGETDYMVCLLPLGGYVKMTGEAAEQNLQVGGGQPAPQTEPASDPGSLLAHPRWQQMLIGVAGPAANFVLAFVLMVFYFAFINEIPDIRTVNLEWITPGSPAAMAGLRPGDQVSSFAGFANPDWQTFHDLADQDAGKTVSIVVRRGDQSVQTAVQLKGHPSGDGIDLGESGIFEQIYQYPIVIANLLSGAPADQAGLKPGDEILAFDGHAFHSLAPLYDYLTAGKGAPIALTIRRNGVVLPLIVVKPYAADSTWRLGFTRGPMKEPPLRFKPLPAGRAVASATDFCEDSSLMIAELLKKLFTHQATIKEISGPIGIMQVAGDAATSHSWQFIFELSAGISINLGIINLLPFPILDGGMILFLLIESVLRRAINIKVKEIIYQAAFLMILAFFLVVSFNDIARLPIFMHFKP